MAKTEHNLADDGSSIWSDLAAALRRRKWTIGIVFAVTVLVVYALVLVLPERYECEARLLVKLGRENTEVPLTVEKGDVYSSGVQKEEINSYIQLLLSRELIEGAIESPEVGGVEAFRPTDPPAETTFQKIKAAAKDAWRETKAGLRSGLIGLGLREPLEEREKAILTVQKQLSAEREKDSNVIRMSLQLGNRELSERLVEKLIDLYLERHVEVRRNAEVRNIFERQAGKHRKELARLQDKAAGIRRRYGITNVEEQQRRLLGRLNDLYSRIDAQEAEAVELAERQAVLAGRLAELPEMIKQSEVIAPNPLIVSVKDRLAELELDRTRIAGRYLEDSDPVRDIDREIASLRAILDKEDRTKQGDTTYQANPLVETLRRELEGVETKLAGLSAAVERRREQAAAVEEQLKSLDAGRDELHMVELERQVVEQRYLSNAKRREEARIAEQLDAQRVANVAVLTPPAASLRPVYPKRMLFMALGAIGGLLLGVSLALLLHHRDDTVYGPRDLESLEGVAVLGTFRPAKA